MTALGRDEAQVSRRFPPSDGSQPRSSVVTSWRIAVETAAVFLVVVVYLWPFRLYGFDVTDEGVQLVQIERVLEGERPYRDFETSYTPGYFALYALLWRATASDLVATRTFGVFLQAATVAATFGFARAWAGGLVAVAVALLYVGFLLPVSLRFGAPFNTPYPGWIASLCALLAQVCAALAAERAAKGQGSVGSRASAAGALAGLAFSVKPNAGLLALGGVALAVTAGWDRGVRVSRGVGSAVRIAALCGGLVLLQGSLEPAVAGALLVPLALASLRVGEIASPGEAREGPGSGKGPGREGSASRAGLGAAAPVAQLLLVAFGFALVVLPWLLPLVMADGLEAIAKAILHLEGSVVRAYAFAYPPPMGATVALGAGMTIAAWLVVRSESRSPDGARVTTAALAPPVALGAALVASAALALAEGGELALALRVVAENAAHWLGPLLLCLGLLTSLRGRAGARSRALLAFASVYQLQVYPRPDLIHVAMSAPSVLLATAVAWSGMVERWRAATAGGGADALAAEESRSRAIAVAAFAIVALLAAGRALPVLVARLTEPVVALDAGSRAKLVVNPERASGLTWVRDAVHAIRESSAPGDAVFAFPDLPGLGFLAERRQPHRFLYFVPGRPTASDQREIIAALDRSPPRVAIVAEPSVPAFAGATDYFGELRDYLGENYRPVAHAGAATVLVYRGPRAGAGDE